jgi:AraC-like DNA-binding protein
LITLDYEAPPPALADYISAYYLFKCDEPFLLDIERADVAQLRFLFEGDATFIFHGGRREPITPQYILGPRTRASQVEIRGPGRLFGFGLQPAGWQVLTKLPAHEHNDRVIDATTIFGDAATDAGAAMAKMNTVQEMAAHINGLAAAYEGRMKAAPHAFIRTVEAWLESRLSPDIADLEAATGLSRRQIERTTKQLFGSPPKLLARKYRALRTANAIAHGKGDWQDFIDEGYYDQSHCIREIKEFVGITPSAVRDHASRLTNLTFDRSNLIGKIATLSAIT